MAVLAEEIDFLKKAEELAELFAVDAAERDHIGGAAKKQRDALRDSGLLKLLIPAEFGGDGRPWSLALKIVRILARKDAALAHLYGYHFLQLSSLHFSGTAEQKEAFYTASAKNNWFWGNAFNPIEETATGRKEGDDVIVDGYKTFSTGSHDADRLLISWVEKGDRPIRAGIIPLTREGVTVNDDWDGFGQRQTGSGSVSFDHVIVKKEEVLNTFESKQTAFATLDALLSQIILGNVFVGSAEGALETAKRYTQTKSRPWYVTDYKKAIDDPFVQRRYGQFWIDIQAAAQLADEAGRRIDQAWEKGPALTFDERGETALYTGGANAFATKVALDVTSNIFEVMGARSATRKNNFDRFWRNARIHSLHNPIEYKRKNIGHWVLTGDYPEPGAYS